MDYQHITHPFPPLYDGDSTILILGSLPSVKSREQNFFYGHPQNRFWPMIAAIFGEEAPKTVEEKKALAHRHHIAMWDTIYSCDIKGSSDSSIRNVVPTDLSEILRNSEITHIYCNGKTSWNYFRKYQEKSPGAGMPDLQTLGITATCLPSTSPANAAWTMEKLKEAWSIIKQEKM